MELEILDQIYLIFFVVVGFQLALCINIRTLWWVMISTTVQITYTQAIDQIVHFSLSPYLEASCLALLMFTKSFSSCGLC